MNGRLVEPAHSHGYEDDYPATEHYFRAVCDQPAVEPPPVTMSVIGLDRAKLVCHNLLAIGVGFTLTPHHHDSGEFSFEVKDLNGGALQAAITNAYNDEQWDTSIALASDVRPL